MSKKNMVFRELLPWGKHCYLAWKPGRRKTPLGVTGKTGDFCGALHDYEKARRLTPIPSRKHQFSDADDS